MNLSFPTGTDAGPASVTTRWKLLHGAATVALFLLTALLISSPLNLLPFGLLFVGSSIVGADYLWGARLQARPASRVLFWLAVAAIGLGLLSILKVDGMVVDEGNRSRFVVMPWLVLWVCALRPRAQALWWGALLGLFVAVAISGWQVLNGADRAEGWTNSIVLADTALVLMVLLVFCRPPARWGLIVLGMAAGGGVILLSGSRGVWPALLSLLVAMALAVRWKSGRFRFMTLIGLTLVAITLVLSVPQLREMTRLTELHSDVQRIENGDVNSSAGARLERLEVAWDTFLEQPLAGVGIGHFDDAMLRVPACRLPDRSEARCKLGHAHNDLAEWGATEGVPGILLLLAVYGLPLWLFIRLHRRSGETEFRGPAAAGIMLVVCYVLCGLTQSMFAHQLSASTYTSLVGILAGFSLLDAAARRRASVSIPDRKISGA